jgi:molecular chaperone GrpE
MSEKEKNIPVDFKEDETQENAATEEKVNEEQKQEMQHTETKEQKEQTKKSEKKKKSTKKSKDQELHEARQRAAELEDRLLRLQAEFMNYKKRTEKNNLELGEYLKGEIIKEFLPVLDDFKHMLDNVKQDHVDVNSILEGIQIIMKKFEQVFEKFGVKKIESLEQEFNPDMHEALMIQPVDDKEKDNKVLQVYQEGYQLNEKVLRPSKVIVGKFEEKSES